MFILKPTVSARSYNTYLIDPYQVNNDPEAHITANYESTFHEMLSKFKDRGIIIQEYANGIANGEYGLVFLNHKLVQAIIKKPGVIQGKKEKYPIYDIPKEVVGLANRVMENLPKDKVLIARVDMVINNNNPYIMELELTEPNIYIRETDGLGLNIYDPEWYLPEVVRVGCHNNKLVDFAQNIVFRIKNR